MKKELNLIFMSNEWLVLDKPSGLLTIPDRTQSDSLVDLAREKFGEIYITHRLDRDTSGIVLFARTAQSHSLANEWFMKRQMKKKYSFLAQFPHSFSEDHLAWPPHWKSTTPIQGAPSQTQFEILKSFGPYFYGQAHPRTGRRHQIRIHLSQAGLPILGDSLYQGLLEISFKNDCIKIKRSLLHASSLTLPTGECFQAPIPNDFQEVLDFLERKSS